MTLLCNLSGGNEQSYFLWICRGGIKDNGTPWDRLSLKLGQTLWLSDLIVSVCCICPLELFISNFFFCLTHHCWTSSSLTTGF